MSFSSIAIEQREKEVKALKTFLVYSTVGSLVLHIAVLASGIGTLLTRVPIPDENQESRSSRLNQRLQRRTEVSASRNEDETLRQRVRNSEQSSIGSRLRRRVENNSESAASTPRKPREVTADVRTSGEQQAPTRRRKPELNQSNQSSDSGSRLRSLLRRSRESAPAAPSNGGEDE